MGEGQIKGSTTIVELLKRYRDVIIAIGHAQANHWGYGGGGKLVMQPFRFPQEALA